MRTYLLFIFFFTKYSQSTNNFLLFSNVMFKIFYCCVSEENDYFKLYFKRLSHFLGFFMNVRCCQTEVKFTQQYLNNCHNNCNKTIFYLRTDSKASFVS